MNKYQQVIDEFFKIAKEYIEQNDRFPLALLFVWQKTAKTEKGYLQQIEMLRHKLSENKKYEKGMADFFRKWLKDYDNKNSTQENTFNLEDTKDTYSKN